MRPQESKRDHYRREAIRLGYRSRASFKLLEIQSIYNIINNGSYVIDLGCSPGGWSQVALQFIGNGKIVGVDTRSMKSLPIHFINTSVDDENLPTKILEIFGKKADVILSDMSPNLSGVWSLDHARQIDLVYKALKLADKVLKENGKMVVKVFEGEMLNQLKLDLIKRFKKVYAFKPKASRKTSSELYLVCIGFKILEKNK